MGYLRLTVAVGTLHNACLVLLSVLQALPTGYCEILAIVLHTPIFLASCLANDVERGELRRVLHLCQVSLLRALIDEGKRDSFSDQNEFQSLLWLLDAKQKEACESINCDQVI